MKPKEIHGSIRGKRLFDLAILLPSLIVLLPLLACITILVRLKLGMPVLYRQVRQGLDGRPFTIYKFRTMTEERDTEGNLLPDGERLTRFGRSLRRTSLDELPEILNVLKGEMSIVGPRPLLMEYIQLYNSFQYRRLKAIPGITGWAQINGRNAISWEEKFKYDVWYVDNRSFLLDLKIILFTIKKVFAKEGISHKGEATMPKFEGTKK